MAKDTEKLIRQLSLISFLMAQGRPVSALEIKREAEGYSDMNDDAFARRFYADRAELESLGIQLGVEKPGEGFFEAELYSLPPENFYLDAISFSDDELADWADRAASDAQHICGTARMGLGDDAVVGEVDKGWEVASRQLYHERRAVGGGSEFASGSGSENNQEQPPDYTSMVRAAGLTNNERVREAAGRALTHRAVWQQLIDHVYRGVLDGSLPSTAGSLIRLFQAEEVALEIDTALAIAAARDLLIPFLRSPSYCLSSLTLDPWSLPMAIPLVR